MRRYRIEYETRLYESLGVSDAWIGRRLAEVVDRCMQAVPVMEWNSETRQKEPNGQWEFDAAGAIRALHELAVQMDFAEAGGGGAESIEDWIRKQGGSKL